MTVNFIIRDADEPAQPSGYVWNSPIEGWCFNKLRQRATLFQTREEAQKVITEHYSHRRGLTIEMVEV